MRNRAAGRVARAIALAAFAGLVTGCGGGGGSTPTTSGAAPAIANLVANFLAQSCTTTLGQAGTSLALSFGYTDPDGDLPAGRVTTTGAFSPSGIVGVQDFDFASGAATITGTTAGNVRLQPCVRFGTDTTFTIGVAAIDGGRNQSNTLTASLAKPTGAP